MRKRIAVTSVESYHEILETLGERQHLVYELIRRYPEHTDRELAQLAGAGDPNQIRPRRTELLDKGVITESGKRRCEVTGKLAKTWRIVTQRDQLELW
ncbi:hypothetical protein [Sediminispirochaeta bajacaliforniensis]|jgi:predicted transcriptional regulator|uniref:hypothetical protein n=1 Tax=Sediminispirochaeta bajacaliforniensis TaxID=148 RepID=UPI000382EB07|nr:hypothetical protein [Sediminispirochaeta bajacaliforniensis]